MLSANISNINEVQTDQNTFRVLQETLYPGSTNQEVAMILSYCKARRIDPILKPVHLVPMNVKTDRKDSNGKFIYERKNVIMPGIALYRIDASRSGQYAGMSEPEFGEDVTENFTGDKGAITKITYPKWCKVTVRKLLNNGSIAEFTAKEYWKENYAGKSKWDNTPNDMWEKRSYGQLAKCAEAQALRKAFPDVVGNDYTKEEMEGRYISHSVEISKPIKPINSPQIEYSVALNIDDVISDALLNISQASNLDELQETYKNIYKVVIASQDKELLKKIIDAKDAKKLELEMVKEFNQEIDKATGEVLS